MLERLHFAACTTTNAITSLFSSCRQARASREKSEESQNRRRNISIPTVCRRVTLESAEAAAEWLHRRIREGLGLPAPPATAMAEQRFVSFISRQALLISRLPGMPEDLEDQAGIWMLLRPEEIGVHLTEGMMMDPEASVSALVFHHPDCTYFSVGDQPEQSCGILSATTPAGFHARALLVARDHRALDEDTRLFVDDVFFANFSGRFAAMKRVLSACRCQINQPLASALLAEIARAGISSVEIFCASSHFIYSAPQTVRVNPPTALPATASRIALAPFAHRTQSRRKSAIAAPQCSIADTERIRRIDAMDEVKRALEVAERIPFLYLIQHLGHSRDTFDPRKMDAAFSSARTSPRFSRRRAASRLLYNTPSELGFPRSRCDNS